MSNLYGESSKDVFYHVSIHLAKRFQRRRFFQKLTNQNQEFPVAAMFVNGSKRNEQSLQRTFHRFFMPRFILFSQEASEEKLFQNRPIRNKNCLWQPYLLMDQDKMSNLYRRPSIDASYQVLVHLVKRFQRRRLLKIGQSETRIACGGHFCLRIETK